MERSLRAWNIAVICVHTASFVALASISFSRLSDARHVSLWADWQQSITSLGSYPIFATLIPFPAITALFHLFAALNVDNYYASVLKLGVNRLRWLEYAITNGLMMWSVTALAGAGNIVLLVCAVLSNAAMQWFGLQQERHKRERHIIWVGFVPYAALWFTIFFYHFERIETALLYDSFAIFGTFAWSLLFVAPLLWRIYQPNTARANYTEEVAYILLSLTAKLYLDWTVIVGNLVA